MPALVTLVAGLPADLEAAVLVVQHIPSGVDVEALTGRLSRHAELSCQSARDGAEPENGVIYLARPDRHFLVNGSRMLLTAGPRENFYRPSADALFRSAAVSWGCRVTGVILTGMLHDGTMGLEFIRRCGGIAVVQDPLEAAFPSMPATALSQGPVDHVATLARMGPLLGELSKKMSDLPLNTGAIPADLKREAAIVLRAAGSPEETMTLGTLAPISCPECGGSLWEMEQGELLRFRCHVGHAFSAAALLSAGHGRIEESLWAAICLMEENRMLLERMDIREKGIFSNGARERLTELSRHIAVLRRLITGPPALETGTPPSPSA